MTTLKTVEEILEHLASTPIPERPSIGHLIEEDRQAIATLLCELLEGERKPLTPEGANHQVLDLYERIGFNDGLTKAQAIIRQTLEGKQE